MNKVEGGEGIGESVVIGSVVVNVDVDTEGAIEQSKCNV